MAVTSDDVKAIYPTSLTVDPFLAIAQTMTTNLLSDKGLDSDTTDSIVIYLTAHLLVLTAENGGLRRDRMGDADESYITPDPKAQGFASTRFGQMAMILDSSGTLAGAGASAGLKASLEVVDVPDNESRQ